jgi:hypothetical protein
VREHWEKASTFESFLETATNRQLWQDLYERARIPEDVAQRARALRHPWQLLVLSEDWCGDAVNTVPLVARLAATTPGLDLRMLARDENPDLMDAHLTGTSCSIPVVMALDCDFVEHGWWGPRPTELQQWFYETGRQLPKEERYRVMRGWYARDRGISTLNEIVELLEQADGEVG